eukprot:TRINITY_DN12985_c0_g1_i1.p1 TRINITY_DN12985_c0_g1~~TRINITY_DN12985_c0_g1_i1.p1  ORF type:complete len:530 (+),score=101.64 TRINITY_DN12985_c0_g1_i1:77-1591(+)
MEAARASPRVPLLAAAAPGGASSSSRKDADCDENSSAEDTGSTGSQGPKERGVSALPDLTDRIRSMGLLSEYMAFKKRYIDWRRGDARGARGEPTAEQLPVASLASANRSWLHWYPTIEEWQWRRTLSYWVAVLFLEGSIFFTVSAFLFNCKEQLGPYYESLTLGGYCAAKLTFVIATYFMCVETINLQLCNGLSAQPTASPSDPRNGQSEAVNSTEIEKKYEFRYWPFCYRTAIANLDQEGLGPCPYYAAVLYFTGVIVFAAGLSVDFVTVPKDISGMINLGCFSSGSLLFVLGSIAECIESETFKPPCLDKAGLAALMNLAGSCSFLLGSLIINRDGYVSNVSFGVGAAFFTIGSSIQVTMWKDEQYGLTFLAALNHLSSPKFETPDNQRMHMTIRHLIFIHLYVLGAVLSVYNFNIQMTRTFMKGTAVNFEHAFNNILPCIISHFLLMLSSAVMAMPKTRPYKQLVIAMRFLYGAIVLNSLFSFVGFLYTIFTVGHAGVDF